FFSSRRRHTRFDCDWSSDVCSSDLAALSEVIAAPVTGVAAAPMRTVDLIPPRVSKGTTAPVLMHRVTPQYPAMAKLARMEGAVRSEERRVGKECRCGGEREQEKKKM